MLMRRQKSIFGANAKRILDKTFKNIHKSKKNMQIEDYIFNISISKVNTLKETEYLVTLNNITDYKIVEKSIIEEQKELEYKKCELEFTIDKLKQISKAGARNYIARELHDIIGHSLVVTIKLIDVAKLYFDRDKNLSKEAVNDSLSSIKAGIHAMDNIKQKGKNYMGIRLKKDIEKMLDRIKLSEINTRLNFKGLYYNLEEKTFDIINRICTELVTNSIKHSQAKEIFISVNIREDGINILYMDNGKGCDDLILGNGLSGIKERLRLIDGTVQYITSDGEGFMSKINI
jgi:signal transduction histidine kinase